jgi:hypothetical protein
MARKAFGLIVAAALSFSWAAPLCAMPAAPSHACCAGGKAPMPSKGGVPACCRVTDAVPATVAAAATAPAPVLLPSAVSFDAPSAAGRPAPARPVPSAPQAPPGTHSGLSPPSSGL